MTNIINKAIKQINQLIQLKLILKEIYNEENDNLDTKELTESKQIDFKIKNYKKWVNKLKELLDEYDNIKFSELKKIKLTTGLMRRLEEIKTNGIISDIDENKKKIKKLKHNGNELNGKNMNILKTQKHSNNDVNFDLEKIIKKKGEYVKPKNEIEENIFNLELIHGIGPKTAKKLAEKGLKLELLRNEWKSFTKNNKNNSILMLEKIRPIPNEYRNDNRIVCEFHKKATHDLESKLSNTKYLKYLKHEQLVGLKYFEDIQKRIPRPQITKMEMVLKYVCEQIDKDLIFVICGSYRRGKETSGDIDMLLTHKKLHKKEDIDNNTSVLKRLVNVLTQLDFLIDHLTLDGNCKYMGICKLDEYIIARRIDIRLIPYDGLAASMLYFTGSKNFNTEMRAHAKMKGYKLNEYGLYKINDNELIPARTEEKLFEILGYEYLEPTKRDF